MFSYIRGDVVTAQDGVAVVECGGIGYELNVSNTALVKLNANKYNAKVFTYLQVRDDGISMYGFHSPEEKSMFLRLISISGVGPKAAMSILSGIELNSLAVCIVTKDVKTLSKVKGIGKKTAERIVLELGESLSKDISLENLEITESLEPMDSDTADAVMALRSLGIGQQEAVKAVKRAIPMAKNIEELISYSLKYLG